MSKNAQDYTPSIIDIEASGFGPESYPIEIGAVLDNGERYCSLISPADGWTYWDDEAERVHRVPRDILEEYGKPMDQVARELNEFMGGRTIYTDGWVVDHPWLNKLFYEIHATPTFSTSALEMILTEPQMEVWHDTKDQVVASMDLKRHRACYDALIIQQTYVQTRAGQPT